MKIVEQCTAIDGGLSPSNKSLLNALLQKSDDRLWLQARHMLICRLPLITLAMAVNQIRHSADRNRSPDPFTIYRALRWMKVKEQRFQNRPDVCDSEC